MCGAPWDIYAEQLSHLGHGYPPWVPDPAPGAAEVEIGDVGWVNDGEFLPLFNALRGQNEAQPKGEVPANHVPLDVQCLEILGPRDKISQSVLCSRSIKKLDVSASAGSKDNTPFQSLGCGAEFEFECNDDAGALLFLEPGKRTHDILSRQRIIDYMGVHFNNWLEFANHSDRLGLGLKEEQIMFVSGTTKTSRWGVAAFQGKARTMRGALVANLVSPAAASFSFSISNAELTTDFQRPPFH
ncbi:hypothetical protein C8Q78DRAFT_1077499 [Trametes maxima]|nr:hypothetical protein C8Q78DRAFT_1077499 [Trametes maxima]